jgi:hypothetical protein
MPEGPKDGRIPLEVFVAFCKACGGRAFEIKDYYPTDELMRRRDDLRRRDKR